jgi:small subunit ribosomal protein S9
MSKTILGTGRRKTSVARVMLSEGEGNFEFNGKTIEDYFPIPSMRMTINKPFNVVGMEKKFNLKVNVNGSGLSAQADAVALGISRALIQFDPELRPKLKKAGLLTRDARKVERKKYGLKKARRAEQFTKR